ncbi:adhesin [Methanobrevibacter sp. DSM 116169]|uniref:adhesin n=1 Tax=Methanobrevibacter sp. DSM 116169 TaxID=3242727 RepID=UPI0038FCC472
MKKLNMIICVMLLLFSINLVAADNFTDVNLDIVNQSNDFDSLYFNENQEDFNEYLDDFNIYDYSICYDQYIRSPQVIFITEDNYENYFNKYTGVINDNADIIGGDILKIGNFTNKAFVIDRKLTITSISDYDTINNGVIYLVSGSDESIITGLRIINTDVTILNNGVQGPRLHGISIMNSNNNVISYNYIRIGKALGVYGMPMGWSSNNTIVYNDIKTSFTTVMPMGLCHNNNISYNIMETLDVREGTTSNVIYYNQFGHADYGGPSTCNNNIISNNYLKCASTSEWCIVLTVAGNSQNTTIINNTVVLGATGISAYGGNIKIEGNTILESVVSIGSFGDNILVSNNTILANYAISGINVNSLEGNFNHNISVCNNSLYFNNTHQGIIVSGYGANIFNNNLYFNNGTYYGIYVNGNYLNIYNNSINMGYYGKGIGINANSAKISNNYIYSVVDDGIELIGSYNVIENNFIYTKARGISINSPNSKCYDNIIDNNVIFSDGYGIFINGLVYHTVISNNIIETNSSEGIYKNIPDENTDDNSDNNINGVIHDASALIIDDNNFYLYFNSEGYLSYTFKEGKVPTIFFTFLTNKNIYFDNKVNIMSNKMGNLLLNVTIHFIGDSSGSIVQDFKFYNNGKTGIILDSVDEILLKNNNLTILSNSNQYIVYGILIKGICEDIIISNNNIYINSKSNNAYGINILANNNQFEFSKNFIISNNNINIFATGLAEGLYTDSLVNSNISNNTINIISDSFAYGIATANIIGRQYGLNITDNIIIIHSKSMVYLIEFHMSDNCNIKNNYLWGEGNGIYGISTYKSSNVTISNNEIFAFGGDLLNIETNDDIMGSGNAAIIILGSSNNIDVFNNLIYTNASKQIIGSELNPTVNFYSNSHIIDNFNYMNYFNNENYLKEGILSSGDVILFNNFTNEIIFIIDISINILSYKNKDFNGILKLISGSNGSNISNLNFNGGILSLSNVNNVYTYNNSFISSNIIINDCLNITLSFNNFTAFDKDNIFIHIVDSSNTQIYENYFVINNCYSFKAILMDNSLDNNIYNNVFEGIGENIIFIESNKSKYNNIFSNMMTLEGYSIFAYFGFDAHYDLIKYNDIVLNGTNTITNQSGIYYYGSSSSNKIYENNIVSYSINGGDYAIYLVEKENLFNQIIGNYLICDNGLLRADYAVFAHFAFIVNNTPFYIYVSEKGSDIEGDGSEFNPYKSISFALKNALNKCVIILLKGTYNENSLMIDKNITITAINTEGDVFIDVEGKQLFTILSGAILTVNALKIFNAHSISGGSVFMNNGTLIINNSIFYDNSAFCIDHSHDCGYGGVILNYGDLIINSSNFYKNLAHKGGVLADFGETIIENSLFYDNSATNGGVIFTDSENELMIMNSVFYNNSALKTLDFCVLNIIKVGSSAQHGDYYNYFTECCKYVMIGLDASDNGIGRGGAIFSNSPISIYNSLFEANMASNGGAIAQYCSFGEKSTFVPTASLLIVNSTFNFNEARDINYGNLTLIENINRLMVIQAVNGGAIYGTLTNCTILNSVFTNNGADKDGGALYIQSPNGIIDDSTFMFNSASGYGGALNLFGNFLVTNTIISNNSAYDGGGIYYESYDEYGHMLNNLNIFNSTISNNIGLVSGGALVVSGGNVSITNSNIEGNLAPKNPTFVNSHGYIYAIGNWWGSSKGPDDSVWNNANEFKSWLNDPVNWKPITIPDDNNGSGNGGPNNPNPIPVPIPNFGTGSSVGTGSSLGSLGNSAGSQNGNGGNTNSGNGTGNNGFGTGQGIPGYNGGNQGGSNNPNGGNNGSNIAPGGLPSKTDGSGDIIGDIYSYNSLSNSNSSNIHSNLMSIGFIPNAVDTSSSSQDTGAGSSSSSSSIVHEISEIEKNILKNENSMYTIIIVLIMLFILLIIGFKHQNKE